MNLVANMTIDAANSNTNNTTTTEPKMTFTMEEVQAMLAAVRMEAATTTNTTTTVTVPAPVATKEDVEVAMASTFVMKYIGRPLAKAEALAAPKVAHAADVTLTKTGNGLVAMGNALKGAGIAAAAYSNVKTPGYKTTAVPEVLNLFPRLLKKYNDPKATKAQKTYFLEMANVAYTRQLAEAAAAKKAAEQN